MSYNASIPQSADFISNSQGSILTNFTQLNTQYRSDHDGFNTGSGNGSGMHDQVTFLANQVAPSLTRNAVTGVSGLYCNTVGTASQLFFQNATTNLQLTGPSLQAGSGYVTLPGGLLLQWGMASIVGSTGIFTFPVPFTTAVYSITLGAQQGVTMWIPSGSLLNVTIQRSGSGASGCNVFAIGK